MDGCTPETLLSRASVQNGRIAMPDGMSYRALVLPSVPAMTPRLLGKIVELVEAGATVIGNPPSRSPGLTDYPTCDQEVKRLAALLWGSGPVGDEISDRTVGKGQILSGGRLGTAPD